MAAVKKILVITSSFKRFHGDGEPDFVFQLVEQLSKKFSQIVLAPSFYYVVKKSLYVSYPVVLYRYFIRRYEKLAYDGGIPIKLENNKLYAILVPFFIMAQLAYGIIIVIRQPVFIIHAHWIIPQGLVAILISRAMKYAFGKKVKVVVTAHGSDYHKMNSRAILAIKEYVLKKSDYVAVVSNHLKNEITNTLPLKSISVAPMGIDTDRFNSSDISRNESEVIFVGRLIQQKGVSYLVEAIVALKSRHPKITLRVIGGGPMELELRDLVSKRGMDNCIFFEGFQSSEVISEAFQRASLCVVPSVGEEGLGLVPIEAMACGCPVIASSYGAISDIIVDQISGYLVESENAYELEQAIDRLLIDRHLRQSLSEKGRLVVRNKYSWAVCAERYEMIYRELLNGS